MIILAVWCFPAQQLGDTSRQGDVVLDVLAERDVPVRAQAGFGHTSTNLPLPIGVRAYADAENRTPSLLGTAVAEG